MDVDAQPTQPRHSPNVRGEDVVLPVSHVLGDDHAGVRSAPTQGHWGDRRADLDRRLEQRRLERENAVAAGRGPLQEHADWPADLEPAPNLPGGGKQVLARRSPDEGMPAQADNIPTSGQVRSSAFGVKKQPVADDIEMISR